MSGRRRHGAPRVRLQEVEELRDERELLARENVAKSAELLARAHRRDPLDDLVTDGDGDARDEARDKAVRDLAGGPVRRLPEASEDRGCMEALHDVVSLGEGWGSESFAGVDV